MQVFLVLVESGRSKDAKKAQTYGAAKYSVSVFRVRDAVRRFFNVVGKEVLCS